MTAAEWPAGAIAVEARCTDPQCGETFNPNGPDDLVHIQRNDDTDCGGLGEIVGSWR